MALARLSDAKALDDGSAMSDNVTGTPTALADASDETGSPATVAAMTDTPGLAEPATPSQNEATGFAKPFADPASEQALKLPGSPAPMGAITALPPEKAIAISDVPRTVQANAQTQSPVLQSPDPGGSDSAAASLLGAKVADTTRPNAIQPTALVPDSSGDVVAALTAAPASGTSNEVAALGPVQMTSSQAKPSAPASQDALTAPPEELAFLVPTKPARVAVGRTPAEPVLKTTGGAVVLMTPSTDDGFSKLDRPDLGPAEETSESAIEIRLDARPAIPFALQLSAPDLLNRLIIPTGTPAFAAAPLPPVTRDPQPAKPAPSLPDLTPAVASNASDQDEAKTTPYFVTGNRVNLRVAPGVAYDVLGQVTRGTKLRAFETVNGWTRVQTVGGQQAGWMSSRYLADSAPSSFAKPSDAKRSYTKPKAASVKRRSSPKTLRRSIATRTEVKRAEKRIIRQSIAKFGGTCTCPYSRDRHGNLCGDSSEWSNPRGYSPICYASDISRRHLSHYFAKRGKTYR